MIEYAKEEKKRITPEFLKKFLRSNFKLYYTTQELNDKLYLHYKGNFFILTLYRVTLH